MPVTKKQKIDDDRSPLWKLVTEIPDLFEKEVLTKLDAIDFFRLIKFKLIYIRDIQTLNHKTLNTT